MQENLDRPVAIKIISNDLDEADVSFGQRFKNEAKAMAKLNHPGIVKVFDYGQTTNGILYIVMEYIEGTDVSRMIKEQGRLRTEHAMAIAAHVCDALAFAHERGIIHRDIKPANIMVGYDGVVKVADFGLAKMTVDGATLGLTKTGMAMGTLHYMAPESLILGAAVDHRADIYAVGVMLCQMLTGKLPQGVMDPPSEQVPGLDPRFDSIIAKAMSEDRGERYQIIRELRSDLDATLTKPVVKVAAEAAQTPAALTTTARPQRPEGQNNRSPLEKMRVMFSGLPLPVRVGFMLGFLVLVLWITSDFWFRKAPSNSSAKAYKTAKNISPENVPTTGTGLIQATPPANPPSNLSDTDLNAGLISWWKGDGDAKDSAGIHHGILRGNVEFADGLFGKAFRIKESNSYVEVPDSPSLRVTPNSPLTVTAWTYRTTSTMPFHILGKRLDRTTPHYQLGIDQRFPSIPSINEWTFWTLVNSGGKTVVYVNGMPTAARVAFDGDDSAPFEIGAAGNYHGFIGLIDDVRIYNRDLPPYQIEALYRQRPVPASSMSSPSSSASTSTISTQPDPVVTSNSPFTNSLGMKFVPIPSTSNLRCVHETRKQDYAAFAAENLTVDGSWKSPKTASGVAVSFEDSHPVVNVNWDDAKAFCAWLSKKERRSYRLPTDNEWSFAVGIGTAEPPGGTPSDLNQKLKNIYPWGEHWPPPDRTGNYADVFALAKFPTHGVIDGYTDGYGTTAPVMSFPANTLGIHDLGGNVLEWCEDWYNTRQDTRTMRGGAWLGYGNNFLLSSCRYPFAPDTRYMEFGFRCVLINVP